MRKLLAALACAAVVMGMGSAARASSDEDYARVGGYIGVGGVYGIELFDDHGARVDNSSGFHVRGGYRLHPNFAVEALYEYLANFDTDPGHYNGWSVTANGKAYLLTGRWQPYVLVGLGYLSMNGSGGNRGTAAPAGNGFVMRFGGGFEMNITENWALGPEVAYDLPFNDAEHLDFVDVSLGVRYKF